MSALSDRIARNTATINAQSALIQSQAATIKAKTDENASLQQQLAAAQVDQADSAAAVAKLDEDNAAAQAVLDANKPA